MRLSEFILENMEELLVEWESFARTIVPPAHKMDSLALRNHAKLMLQAIAKDIETDQTDREQSAKSKGLARPLTAHATAATTHGLLRQMSGFDLMQLGSEFRALRASVIRQWTASLDEIGESEFDEMVRFNEAIDQALAESIASYSEAVDHSRQTFLAILGHDLRGPLSAITTASHILLTSDALSQQELEVASRIKRSVRTMTRMVQDLLEYAAGQIGNKIPIRPQSADMGHVCRGAVDEVQLAFPDVQFSIDAAGELEGTFDPTRFRQVLSNLLINAAKYRDDGTPVTLSARKDQDTITLEVKNFGTPIPEDSLQVIFNPLVQLARSEAYFTSSTSLGLGLFIAREIVEGHGGNIEVNSSEADGTVFRVRIPHKPSARAASV